MGLMQMICNGFITAYERRYTNEGDNKSLDVDTTFQLVKATLGGHRMTSQKNPRLRDRQECRGKNTRDESADCGT